MGQEERPRGSAEATQKDILSEGSYLGRCQPASGRSEAGRAAGCCGGGVAAGTRGAGRAWPCAWRSLSLMGTVERRVSSETPSESPVGTPGDGERAAGLLVTASLSGGPCQSEFRDMPLISISFIHMSSEELHVSPVTGVGDF